jgi:hypothetical protein
MILPNNVVERSWPDHFGERRVFAKATLEGVIKE